MDEFRNKLAINTIKTLLASIQSDVLNLAKQSAQFK